MLTIETNTSGIEQSIILTGQLKGIDALEFRQKLSSLIDNNADRISLSLQALESVDLIGFNAVVILKKEVENQRKQFRVMINNNPDFLEYLHMSKLDLNCIKTSEQ